MCWHQISFRLPRHASSHQLSHSDYTSACYTFAGPSREESFHRATLLHTHTILFYPLGVLKLWGWIPHIRLTIPHNHLRSHITTDHHTPLPHIYYALLLFRGTEITTYDLRDSHWNFVDRIFDFSKIFCEFLFRIFMRYKIRVTIAHWNFVDRIFDFLLNASLSQVRLQTMHWELLCCKDCCSFCCNALEENGNGAFCFGAVAFSVDS